MAGHGTPAASTKRLVVGIVLFVALTLVASIIGSYIVGLHEGSVAATKAIHAAQIAEQGRSKSLCGALKQLAETDAAVKLHPIFVKIYGDTGCARVTGAANQ